MDDQEQFSHDVNLILVDNEVHLNDASDIILTKIKEEVNGLSLPKPDVEYGRCHRIDRKYTRNGKTYQDVLINYVLLENSRHILQTS